MDRGCYNEATNQKSTATDENFLFGGILNKGNYCALSEPVSRMGAIRNDSQKPFKKNDKRVAIELKY
jgi:hypothetical protein